MFTDARLCGSIVHYDVPKLFITAFIAVLIYWRLWFMQCAISAICTIEAKSYNHKEHCSDKLPHGYLKLNNDPAWEAGIMCDKSHHITRNRGVNIHLVDPDTCSLQSSERFDTYKLDVANENLIDYLEHRRLDEIIVAVTADEPMRLLNDKAKEALKKIGADVSDIHYRGTFAFVTQKGYPSDIVFKKVKTSSESSKNPAQVTRVFSSKQGANYCSWKSDSSHMDKI